MSRPTVDHEEIRLWAEHRQAVPVEVSPYKFDSEPAILRLVFGEVPPDQAEMREITWDSFFAQFDLLGLVFLGESGKQYQLLNADAETRRRYEGKVVTATKSPAL